MVLVLLLLAISAAGRAGESVSKNAIPALKNIGFIENPPKELKEKFPMCDAFLKVEWIDKAKNIGYSRYDLYRDGKKDERPAFALIHIDNIFPHFDYDLSVFEGVGRIGIEKVFEIIKKGRADRNDIFLIIKRNDGEELEFRIISGTRDVWNFTLADDRLNVCIPYPDNQRMWIAEGKRVDKIYSKEKSFDIFKKLKTFIEFPPERLGIGFYLVIDMNFDGKEDYVGEGGRIIYSYGSKYYAMEPVRKKDAAYADDVDEWSFPPTQKKCKLNYWLGPNLTTDGKNYFLNNQCNLTELTKGGK
jgi:hypothetical protein